MPLIPFDTTWKYQKTRAFNGFWSVDFSCPLENTKLLLNETLKNVDPLCMQIIQPVRSRAFKWLFFQQHRFKYVFWFTCDATLLIFSRSLRTLVNQRPKTELKSKRVASAKIQIESSVKLLDEYLFINTFSGCSRHVRMFR